VKPLLWIPVLLGAAGVFAWFDDESGLRTWLRLGADLRSTQARIAEVQGEIADLQRESAGLENDPLAIEGAIREDLGFARPGEAVVRLPTSDRTNTRIP
jgi:cell division protein FtsB